MWNTTLRRGVDAGAQIVRVMGLLSSVLTVTVGLVHVFTLDVSLHWPKQFASDANAASWRYPLFTLNPILFIDIWTPLALGLFATKLHLRQFAHPAVTSSFLRYFFFLFFKALYADFAYAGGWGIVSGAFALLTCLLCLAAFVLLPDAKADLDLDTTRLEKAVTENRFALKKPQGHADQAKAPLPLPAALGSSLDQSAYGIGPGAMQQGRLDEGSPLAMQTSHSQAQIGLAHLAGAQLAANKDLGSSGYYGGSPTYHLGGQSTAAGTHARGSPLDLSAYSLPRHPSIGHDSQRI